MNAVPSRRPGDLTLAALVAVCGVVVSIAGALWIAQRNNALAEAEFGHHAERTARDIVRRFTIPLYGLRGAAGTYAAIREIRRAEFRAYVKSRDIDREFPGVRGFGLIERVPAEGLDDYLARAREDGAPDFRVRRLSDKPPTPHYVIRYIEPLSRNAAALGLDVGSEARRRATIERAIDSGEPALTDPIVLLQDGRKSAGFLLYLPIYGAPRTSESVELRRASLRGVLYTPIVAGELLAAAEHEASAGYVAFGLTLEGAPVFASASSDGHAPRFNRSVPLHVVDRDFTLEVYSTPAFEATLDRRSPWLALAAGLFISSLLSWALMVNTRARHRAEARAAGMTAELERLAAVARATSDGVLLLDRERRITWVNEAFTRATGYTLDDVRGQRPSQALRSGTADPAAIGRMRARLAAGEGYRGELCNLAKDGRTLWIDVDIQPLRGGDGQVEGWVAVESDITERRDTAQALAAALRDNEALLGTIRTHAIVSVADRGGRIIEVNDAFCAISGYAREELIGQDHRLVDSGVHPRSFWLSMWRSIAIGQSWRAEVCNRAKDGSLYWVDSIVAPFVGADGKIEKYVSLRTDVTAAKQAMLDLARERERLATILAGTGAGTWEHDFDSGHDTVNAAYARMLGDTIDGYRQRSGDDFMSLVHPDDRLRVSTKLKEHAEGHSADYAVEFRMRHRAGHWVWIESRGRIAERNAGGRPLRMAGIHLDVSARHALQDELRRAGESLQTIFENLPSAVSVFGPDLRLVASNQKYWDLLDFPREAFGGKNSHFEDFIRFDAHRGEYGADDTEQIVAQTLARVRGTVEPHRFERTRPNGVTLEVRGGPMPGGGFVTTYTDISETRRLAHERERATERLRAVIEALPCGLTVHDRDGQITLHNSRWSEMYGFDAAFLADGPLTAARVGRTAWRRGDYGDVDETQALAAVADRVADACMAPHLWERPGTGGRILEIRSQPERVGESFVTTYTDVSEQRRVHGEHERARNLLIGAIETIDEAFVIYDPDDRLVLCNERYREVYAGVADQIQPGVSFEALVRAGAERGDYREAVGRVDEWVAERVAKHRAADTDLIQSLASGRTLRIIERRLPDGHIVGFRVDVTALAQAREAAEEASRAKSQFLATMSHEIRTPMHAVLGMLKLLRRTPLNLRQADYAAKAEGAARSLLGLLNDILDFSKIEAGKMELDPQPFLPATLLTDLNVLLQAHRADKPIDLRFEVDDRLPEALRGDALRLQQVLTNLGGNALKFTASGEVVVGLRVLHDGGWCVQLRVSVRDTGIGIAPEHQDRIFSGFTQAEASTTRRYGGTGLGVAISQRLVRLMGGELRLDSQPGQGSRFWFDIELPRADAADVTDARDEGGAACGRLQALCLLLAEDNENNQQIARELLEGEGATVTIVGDGGDAVQALRAPGHGGFDVVLMDLQMPTMDGLKATRLLRADGCRLPIIGLSANAMAADRQACLDAGMDEHVGKPFDLDALVRLLCRVTGRAPVPASVTKVADADPPGLRELAFAAGVRLVPALERFGGRRDLYLRMLRDLVERPLPGWQAPADDPAAAACALHGLKGLAGTFGIDALAVVAGRAEAALAESTDPEACARILAPVQDAVAAALPALRALVPQLAAAWASPRASVADVGPAQRAAAALLLSALAERLSAADMEAVALMDRLREGPGAVYGDRLEPLQAAIDQLDFERALAVCRGLGDTACP